MVVTAVGGDMVGTDRHHQSPPNDDARRGNCGGGGSSNNRGGGTIVLLVIEWRPAAKYTNMPRSRVCSVRGFIQAR